MAESDPPIPPAPATPPTAPAPPATELRDLVAQAVAVEYLRYLQPAKEKPDAQPKPKWLQLFESAGFTAMVTVILGGIAGGVITNRLQEHSKAREQQAAYARLDHDRNLTAFKEHLDRERKVVDEMFLRLGKFVDASRDLTTLSRIEFCETCKGSKITPDAISQRHEVVKRYNDATVDWNTNRLRLGMLLQLEHNDDPQLLDAWKKTCDAAEAYAECADRWRTLHRNLTPPKALKACSQVRETLDNTLQVFTKRIVELRQSSGESESQDQRK